MYYVVQVFLIKRQAYIDILWFSFLNPKNIIQKYLIEHTNPNSWVYLSALCQGVTRDSEIDGILKVNVYYKIFESTFMEL